MIKNLKSILNYSIFNLALLIFLFIYLFIYPCICQQSANSLSPSENKGKILFDESHHQFWTACADSALIDYANELRNNGYQVDILSDGPITYSKLKEYNVLAFPNGFVGKNDFSQGVKFLTDEEIDAVEQFVQDGGGLALFECGWSWPQYTGLPIDEAPINQLGKIFGITLNDDIIHDPTNHYSGLDDNCPLFYKPFIKDHLITKDVQNISNCEGIPSSLTITNPNAEILITGDDDAYSDKYPSGQKPPFMAAVIYGKGKVVVFGQVGFFTNLDGNKDGIKNINEYDNKKLSLNIMQWLSSPINSQACNGVISGHVYINESKNPMNLAILENPKSCKASIQTGEDGNYSLKSPICSLCPETDQEVSCKKDGFNQVTKIVTTDSNGNVENVDFYLNPLSQEIKYKWYEISLNNEIYTLYIIATKPIPDPYMKPLSQIDSLKNISIVDSKGNILNDIVLGRRLIILAQSSARFVELSSTNFILPISSVIMHSEKRNDDKNINYLIIGPDATADWWRTLFIYKGIPVALPGLDSYDYRVEKWKEVILDAILQPDISDQPTPDEDLGSALEGAGWTLEAINDLNDANNIFKITKEGNNIFLLDPHGNAESILFKNHEKFGDLLGALEALDWEVALALEIKADAWKKLLLYTLANERAKEKLTSLEVIINKDQKVDPALVEGYNEAKKSFENEILKEYNNWEKDVLSEALKLDKAIDLWFITNDFASVIGKNPAIARVWLPWFLSWETYRYLRNSNEIAQKSFLAATFQSYISENTEVKGLESIRKELSASDPKEADKIEKALYLYNIDYYLGYYFHQNFYDALNNQFFKLLDETIGGKARSDYLNMLQVSANLDKANCRETRHPQLLTEINFFGWHDYSQLVNLFKGGTISP